MKIKIWSVDNGSEDDSAEEKEINDYDPEDLRLMLGVEAEDWFEKHHPDYDCCDQQNVGIRLIDYPYPEVKTLWVFLVTVEMEPAFHATEVKKKP